MRPRGIPKSTNRIQAALRARPFAGFFALAYRSHAREGMRPPGSAPMRRQSRERAPIKATEKISELIIGKPTRSEGFDVNPRAGEWAEGRHETEGNPGEEEEDPRDRVPSALRGPLVHGHPDGVRVGEVRTTGHRHIPARDDA